ncbi:MAG: sensor histidine kinase [Devosia sp.]|uniref:sensor histidine kinase n=1 Tax=Devosia sp. TaxID=1871048 RepID=UPI0024CAF0AB|nr:sensor histidine kinase [Devosia sp.]UYN98912.1 MAG: sensor histidine kinase [Devosia sp.]
MAEQAASDGTRRTGAGQVHARPIAVYLLALVLVILLPAMAVALVLLNRANDGQQDVLRALTNATVQAMGHSVDREIAGMATTLRVLSTTQSLQDGDLEEFHQRALQALAGTGTYLQGVDADLNVVLNTWTAFDAAPVPTSDPATARRTLERGVATISGLEQQGIGGAPAFYVWLPIKGGSVNLLALVQNARNLMPALQSRQLPDGWHAALVDANNLVVAATADAEAPIGSLLPLRQTADDAIPPDGWDRERLDEAEVVTAEWRSGYTGWRIVAWAATNTVEAPLQQSLVQLAGWGLIIAVLASVVAFLIAQRVGLSVTGLRLDAQRLGRGETLYPRAYPVAEITEVSRAMAEAGEQRLAAERDIRFLMRELAHRSKNQMAVIAAMAKQTARGATDLPSYVQALERRIMGLARSTDLLLASGRQGISLRELVDLQLEAFRPRDLARLVIEGADLRINPQGTQILGMALHEMAVNAMRHGAFAEAKGSVRLDWEIRGDRLAMGWREVRTTPVVEDGPNGFGTTVLRHMVGGSLGAGVERIAHDDGLEWRFDIPLSALDPAFAAARPDEKHRSQ